MLTIRIALLHHALGRFGGAEKMAALHSINLRKMGCGVELFYSGPIPNSWREKIESNLPLNPLPYGLPSSFQDPLNISKLIHRLRQFEAVLVHHHICPFLAYHLTRFVKTNLFWYCGEPLRALWEDQLSGIPCKELRSTVKPTSQHSYGKYLTSIFLSDTLYSSSVNLLRALDKKTAKSYTKIITNSTYTRRVVRKLYDPKARISVVHPGIEINQGTRNPLNNNSNDYMLAIGAMIPMKNHINLLKAYRQLPSKHRSKVELVIIGEGPTENHLYSTAQKLGLNKLIFRSHVDEEELTQFYRNCKFIIHLALYEPFGLVPVEAALFGKPSIVSNRGGTKDFIEDGENGILVDPYDPENIANEMKRLIENEPLAAEMGAKAKEKALNGFTIKESTEKLVQALQEQI